MKQLIFTSLFSLMSIFSWISASGQEAITASGGAATGSGGSASFSAGQLVYTEISGVNIKIIQGVQQPYEISVLTSIETAFSVTLGCRVYPNPASDYLRLEVKPFEENSHMRFLLFNMNGVILQEKKIIAAETEIYMNYLTPAVYLLRVIKDNVEIKVFRIVKR